MRERLRRLGGVILCEDITERKRAEESLRHNRERLDFVTEASEVGIWFCDLPFNELVWDRRVKEHFWLPPEAIVTIETFYERLHPDDRERTRTAIEHSIANKTRYDIEYRTMSPDGREKSIRAIGRAVYDSSGHPTRFDGVTLDMSEYKISEESLRASREALAKELVATRRLQAVSAQLIRDDRAELLYDQILDVATVIMGSDCASLQMFYPERGPGGELKLLASRGFAPTAAMFWEWVQPTSHTTCGIALRKAQRIIVPHVNASDLIKDGEDLATYRQIGIQSVQSTPLVSRSGQILGMISTHWLQPHQPSEGDLRLFDVLARQAADMVERKKDAQNLREQQQQYEALVRASAQIVWTAAPDGEPNEDSPTWNTFTGQTFEQRTRFGWLNFVHPDDRERVAAEWQTAVAAKTPIETEYRLCHTSGEWRWMVARSVPLLDENGDLRKWVGMSTDITARKSAELKVNDLVNHLERRVVERTVELAQTIEQMRDLSTALLKAQDEERRHIARELHDSAGQLLTVLVMNVSSIAQQTQPYDVPELKAIVEDTEKLAQELSQEIRTVSYLLHPPLLDESGLAEALRWYIRGLKERSGLDISLNVSDDLGRLPRDLELVIFRLIQESLTNVHRHSGSNKASLRLHRDVESVLVEVEDHGKGITRDRLLEIKMKGSGVGIQGMRERVHQFGGLMNIESNGHGTKIQVTFPKSIAILPEVVTIPNLQSETQDEIGAVG